MSGGSYQYLATADHILRYLRNNRGELASIALHVRPTSLASGASPPTTTSSITP